MKYSKDAAEWSSKLQNLEFALTSSNMPDVALFDFTSMYSATNASCAKKIYLKCCDNHVQLEQNTKYTLMLLCGDSLLEPVRQNWLLFCIQILIVDIFQIYSFGQLAVVLDVVFFQHSMLPGQCPNGTVRLQMKWTVLMQCSMLSVGGNIFTGNIGLFKISLF